MALRLGSCKAILMVALSSYFCKSTVSFIPTASRSNSKSGKLTGLEKGTPSSNYVGVFAFILLKSILTIKYIKADLIKILKIFLETKSQEPKAKFPCKQSLKVMVFNMYFEKLYIDCYYFCQ